MTLYADAAAFSATLAINLLLIGSPVAIGVAVAFRLIRLASPRSRYVIAVIAFLIAAILPTLAALNVSQRQPSVFTATGPSPNYKHVYIPGASNGSGHPKQSNSYEGDLPQPALFDAPKKVDDFVRLVAYSRSATGFFVVWTVIAILLVVREVLGHVQLVRARRTWRRADVSLREKLGWPDNTPVYMDDHQGPCAVGFLRPVVLIPARLFSELPLEEARCIARHELAHVRSRDPLVNALLRLVRAILWPSLPLWYLESIASLEREAAADRAAILASQPLLDVSARAARYASALVLIAKRSRRIVRYWHLGPIATEISDRSRLETRVRRLLVISSRPTAARLCLAGIVLSSSVLVLALVPLASVPAKVALEMLPGDAVNRTGAVENGISSFLVAAIPNETVQQGQTITLPGSDQNLKTVPAPQGEASNDYLAGIDQSVPVRRDGDSFDFVSEMAALGYVNLSTRQLVAMRAYAVTPAYVRELAAIGYDQLPADTLITFRWLGVTSSYVKEMSALGYDGLSAAMLVNFRELGVSSAYIKEMRMQTPTGISSSQLVSMRLQGVTTEFILELESLGYERLTANQLISMRLQGVTTEFILELESLGYERLTANQLISMRLQGITVAYIEKMKTLGFKDLSPATLISLRMKGIN